MEHPNYLWGGRAQQTCSLLSEQNGNTLPVVRDKHRKPQQAWSTCSDEWLLSLCVNTHKGHQNKKQNFSCPTGHWRTQKIPVSGVLSLLACAMLGFSHKRCFRQTEFQSSTNRAGESCCSLKKQATVQMTDTTMPAMFLADHHISLK